MTTAISAQPITAAAFFFSGSGSIGPIDVVSSDQASIRAMADALQQQGALGSISAAVKTLSRAGLGAVSNQIATAAYDLLNLGLDLGGPLVTGWCQFADLTAAAKRTAAAPGSVEVVDLATHSITWTHNPQIDVLVNDARGPPRVFRTAELSLFHAASCRFRYSSRASCGVRYPSPE
jgi:hypothetical protein